MKGEEKRERERVKALSKAEFTLSLLRAPLAFNAMEKL